MKNGIVVTKENAATICANIKKALARFHNRQLTTCNVYTRSFKNAKKLLAKPGNRPIFTNGNVMVSQKMVTGSAVYLRPSEKYLKNGEALKGNGGYWGDPKLGLNKPETMIKIGREFFECINIGNRVLINSLGIFIEKDFFAHPNGKIISVIVPDKYNSPTFSETEDDEEFDYYPDTDDDLDPEKKN